MRTRVDDGTKTGTGTGTGTIFGDVICAMFPPSLFCVELGRSMVDISTFEDPIDVILATGMLLHLPGRHVGRRLRIRSV